MFNFLFDLIGDIFAGGTPEAKRTRALRRKLARYIKNAPNAAFLGSDGRYLSGNGEICYNARNRVHAVSKKFDAKASQEWESLCCAFLDAAARELPGLVVQLPPDEPRMVYAGDKQL